MPAQAVDVAGALGHEIFSMVHQQPQLASGPVQLRGGEIAMGQRRPRHRQRVDGVRLAIGAGRVPGMSHQLRGHTHDALTRGQQVGLETARQVAAVLHRPGALVAESRRPPQEFEMVFAPRRRCRLLTELAADVVDGHDGVGALERIDAKGHHVPVAFHPR
jgi:hypothetical protein